ncbi:DNA-directed DNA polymerase [Tanacetum coccineum]
MSKTRGDYRSVVTRPKIDGNAHFELKVKFLKELRDNTFSGLEHEDANEHIEKVLEIVDLFHILIITQDQIILRAFPISLTGAVDYVPTRQILNSKGAIPTKTVADEKVAIQEMAQLNSLMRVIKKVNKKVYATQFGAPYQSGGQYRAAGPGFYQQNNGNSLYPDRRKTKEELLTKFMAELAKRHKENSNIIKEIRASTDAAIRNQGASIKTLEIQIGQMSKVLQERGFRTLVDLGASVSVMPFSTNTNLGLGDLAHTRLTVELADITIKHLRGIVENVLVRIGFTIIDNRDEDVTSGVVLGMPFCKKLCVMPNIIEKSIDRNGVRDR